MKHPNATVAGTLTGTAAIVAYLATLVGIDLPDYVAIIAAGAVTTVVLAVGRQGVRGILRRVWAGV